MKTLSTKLQAHQEEAAKANREGYLYIDTNAELQKKQHYSDFVAAQVKVGTYSNLDSVFSCIYYQRILINSSSLRK